MLFSSWSHLIIVFNLFQLGYSNFHFLSCTITRSPSSKKVLLEICLRIDSLYVNCQLGEKGETESDPLHESKFFTAASKPIKSSFLSRNSVDNHKSLIDQ